MKLMTKIYLLLLIINSVHAMANENNLFCPEKSLPVYMCKSHPETGSNTAMKNLLNRLLICNYSKSRPVIVVDKSSEILEYVSKQNMGEITIYNIFETPKMSEPVIQISINSNQILKNSTLVWAIPANNLKLTCKKIR